MSKALAELPAAMGNPMNSIVTTACSILMAKREDLQPNETVSDLRQIDFTRLKTNHKEHVIMDVDQTIVPHGTSDISDEMTVAIENLKSIYGSHNLCFLTNERNARRNEEVEHKTGIKVIRPQTKKPASDAFQPALQHMKRADPTNVVMVGDRLFTDVLGGNQLGMYTVKTIPLSPHLDPLGVKIARLLEKLHEYLGIRILLALFVIIGLFVFSKLFW